MARILSTPWLSFYQKQMAVSHLIVHTISWYLKCNIAYNRCLTTSNSSYVKTINYNREGDMILIYILHNNLINNNRYLNLKFYNDIC